MQQMQSRNTREITRLVVLRGTKPRCWRATCGGSAASSVNPIQHACKMNLSTAKFRSSKTCDCEWPLTPGYVINKAFNTRRTLGLQKRVNRRWNVLVIQQELSLQHWKLQDMEIKLNLYKVTSSNAKSGLCYLQTFSAINYRSLVLFSKRKGVSLPCSMLCTIIGLWDRHLRWAFTLNKLSKFKAASYKSAEFKAIFTCSIFPSGWK